MNLVSQSQSYRHPGQAFISRYGLVDSEIKVFQYVDFLRQEARLSDFPPVGLEAIYQHFKMPTPLRAPLVDQQGILVNSDAGVILIKEDDPIVRQRFTEGHELMELLFDAQERLSEGAKLPWNEQEKEKLCDRGAAELLMPQSSFIPQLQASGMSLQTGCTLANLYQTSLLATMLRMMQYGVGAYVLIMWHSALTRKEMQMSNKLGTSPQEKLRVWWSTRTQNWHCGFIPKNKSISQDSLIFKAHATGQAQEGTETLDLGWGSFECRVEVMPVQIGDKNSVLSLLKF